MAAGLLERRQRIDQRANRNARMGHTGEPGVELARGKRVLYDRGGLTFESRLEGGCLTERRGEMARLAAPPGYVPSKLQAIEVM